MLSDTTLKIRIQSGTGISTATTFYYNVQMDVLSRSFDSVYDETSVLLVFSTEKEIIVRDIFDKSKYYIEFKEFKNSLADIPNPFIDVKFINGNLQLEITYLSGNDLIEFTDTIDLIE